MDWNYTAFCWHDEHTLVGIDRPFNINYDNLFAIEDQKLDMALNTSQFMQDRPADHILLSGISGLGKSLLIKATLNAFSDQYLRLIRLEKTQLIHLPAIFDKIKDRHEKFILYCNHLSFTPNDPNALALASALRSSPSNLLIYAISQQPIQETDPLPPLFPKNLTFSPLHQDQFLSIAHHWLKYVGCRHIYNNPPLDKAAIDWANNAPAFTASAARAFAGHWMNELNPPN